MATLMLGVFSVIGHNSNPHDDRTDLRVYNSLNECGPGDSPVLEFSVGNIGEEILAFTVIGYNDISMLKAFCEQVMQAHERDERMPF